jgi:hypothetical protein
MGSFAACSQTVMLRGSMDETVAFDISDTEHPSYQYSNLEPPRNIGKQHHGKREFEKLQSIPVFGGTRTRQGRL